MKSSATTQRSILYLFFFPNKDPGISVCCIFRVSDSISKSVSGSTMLGSIILQICPKLICQCIFIIYFCFKNILHNWFGLNRCNIKTETGIPAISLPVKPDNQNTFPVLRHIVLSIQYSMEYFIVQFFQNKYYIPLYYYKYYII